MDVEQTALELVGRWYASRAGVMANGESRDLLIAAVAAALRAARAAGIEEAARIAERHAATGSDRAIARARLIAEHIRALKG